MLFSLHHFHTCGKLPHIFLTVKFMKNDLLYFLTFCNGRKGFPHIFSAHLQFPHILPVWNGGYSQNGRNLGGFPCCEGPAGQLLRSAWSAASGQALLSGFSRPLAGKKAYIILTKIFPARHLLLVTMLIFAFTRPRYRILKGLREPASVGNL